MSAKLLDAVLDMPKHQPQQTGSLPWKNTPHKLQQMQRYEGLPNTQVKSEEEANYIVNFGSFSS